MIYKYPY